MVRRYLAVALTVSLLFGASASAQSPMPGSMERAPMPMADMKAMMQMHQQARTLALAALSPAHKALLAQVVGQLAVSATPNFDAAAKQLDSALSASEKSKIMSIAAMTMGKMRAMMPPGHPMRAMPPMTAGMVLLMLTMHAMMPPMMHPGMMPPPMHPMMQRMSQIAPTPPGTVVQNVTVYLTGEGMSSRWHAVTSKVYKGGTTKAYQWYISIYAPAMGDSTKLAFQTPGTNSLLTTLSKANGADMYFPQQTASIVGGAELENPTVQDVVVMTHETGADCGTATVAILGSDTTGKVSVRAKLQNYCDLTATIVKIGSMQAVQLTGPYYAANAPLYKPTKNKATATVRYSNGKWVETPMLFKFAK